MAMDTLINLW